MAAGTVVLAHNSGGPRMDIIVPRDGQPTGFLADSVAGYAEAMARIFSLSAKARTDISRNAREHVRLFSAETFEQNFLAVWDKYFTGES